MPPSRDWFIERDGQRHGPVSRQRLQELAARGVLRPETRVSRDRVHWIAVGEIDALTMGTAQTVPKVRPVAKPPPLPSRTASSRNRQTLWIAGGMGVVATGVFALFGFLLLVAVFRPMDSRSPQGVDPWRIRQETAQRTLQYWSDLGAILHSSDPRGLNSQAAIQVLEDGARRIGGLPTVGVDADAVRCGLNAAAVLQNIANFSKRTSGPAVILLFAEGMVRGGRGDPYGAAADLFESQNKIRQQVEAFEQEQMRVRAVLTARYETEFPVWSTGY